MKNTSLLVLRFLYKSNIWISISLCCLGVFVALLLKGNIDWTTLVSLFLLSWQVYVFDRFLIHPEDLQQTDMSIDNARFVRRNRKIFGLILIVSLLIQFILAWFTPTILLALALNYALSLAYIVKIPFTHHRAKTIPYIKALYVSFTYLATMVAYAYIFPSSVTDWKHLGLLLLLCTGNISIFDIKDRDNDRLANIKTWATLLKPKQLVLIQIIIAVCIALALFILDGDIYSRCIAWSFLGYALMLVRFLFGFSVDYLFICIDAVFALPLLFLLLI